MSQALSGMPSSQLLHLFQDLAICSYAGVQIRVDLSVTYFCGTNKIVIVKHLRAKSVKCAHKIQFNAIIIIA